MPSLGLHRLKCHAGLAETSRTGVQLRTKGRETRPGTAVSYDCVVEPPEAGWRPVAVEYSLEGWFRPQGSDDIDYRSGYGPGPQPYPVWTRQAGLGTQFTLTVTPHVPGHFTTHVRALVQRGTGKSLEQRYAAYAGRHTVLVLAADADHAEQG